MNAMKRANTFALRTAVSASKEPSVAIAEVVAHKHFVFCTVSIVFLIDRGTPIAFCLSKRQMVRPKPPHLAQLLKKQASTPNLQIIEELADLNRSNSRAKLLVLLVLQKGELTHERSKRYTKSI